MPKKELEIIFSKTFPDLERTAESGDIDSQYRLATLHHRGRWREKDIDKAMYWFEKAAEKGHSDAQFYLGCIFSNDDFSIQKPDYDKSLFWIKKAAEQGYARAQYILADIFIGHEYEGITASPDEILSWLTKAASQGFLDAQRTLAICYDSHHFDSDDEGIFPLSGMDDWLALYWYEQAAEGGNSRDMWALSCFLIDFPALLEMSQYWLKMAADHGHLQAKESFAQVLLDDEDPKSDLLGFEHLISAAESGSPEAQSSWARLLRDGILVESNLELSNYWLTICSINDEGMDSGEVLNSRFRLVDLDVEEYKSFPSDSEEEVFDFDRLEKESLSGFNGQKVIVALRHMDDMEFPEAKSLLKETVEVSGGVTDFLLGVCHEALEEYDDALSYYGFSVGKGSLAALEYLASLKKKRWSLLNVESR